MSRATTLSISLPGDYEKRVFIGGNYDFMATLREIKKFVDETGFLGIIALEHAPHDIQREQLYDFDLRLIHECKYAIFEETSPAGELLEIGRASRDYNKTVFVFFQIRHSGQNEIPNQVSSMLYGLNLPMFGYATFDELHGLITDIFTRIEDDPLATWLDLLKKALLPPEVKTTLTKSIVEQMKRGRTHVK